VLQLAGVGLAYWIAARLSLELALVRGQVTPIWPPTGIAVVSILLLGRRIWPAVALGAFAVNLPLGPSPLAAACIAGGNTLAPVLAAELLRRAGFRRQVDRVMDAIAIVLAALIGMTISASVGSSVLVLSGAIPTSSFLATWAVWWAGDAMGVLLVAPLLLSLLPRPGVRLLTWLEGGELALLLAGIGVATYFLFQSPFRLEYLALPLIGLAAWRFRLQGAAPAALIASVIAVWSAVRGSGPFVDQSLLEKMVTLQTFNVSVSLASFVLASLVDASEQREEIARRYRAASLAMAAKTDAIDVAAHELGPPVSVITSYLAILSDGSLGPPPAKWRQILNVMNDKAWQLDRIIRELVDAAQIESKAQSPNRGWLDLRDVVKKAVERARPRAELGGAQVAITLPPDPVAVEADERQIGRILDHLINNSLTYTVRSPHLELAATIERNRAVIRVSDDGVGMSERERERLFLPFHRTEHPSFSGVPRLGLGLYASKQLAEANKGTLTLEQSEPGHGTRFALSLPVSTSKPPQEPVLAAAATRRERRVVSSG
jgi:signal transduction histidine kinase